MLQKLISLNAEANTGESIRIGAQWLNELYKRAIISGNRRNNRWFIIYKTTATGISREWIDQHRCQVAERLLIREALSASTASGIIMIVLEWFYEHRRPMVDQILWDWVDQQRGQVKCEWDHHDHPRMNLSASRRTSYVAGIIIII
jgi:hypothetical protein